MRLRHLAAKLRAKLQAVDAQQENLAGIISQISAEDWPMQKSLHAKIREVTKAREQVLRRLEPVEARLSGYEKAMMPDIAWVRRQKRLAGKLLHLQPHEQYPLLLQLVHAVSLDLTKKSVRVHLRVAPFAPSAPKPEATVWFCAAVTEPGQTETIRRWHPEYGSLPYGYGNLHGNLVVVPEEAEVVRFVYRKAARGSRRTAVAALAEWAGSSALAPTPWDHNRVTCMIRNPRYCGMEARNRSGRKCRLSQCRESAFPPIVSREEWLAAQSSRKVAKRGKRR